MRVKLMIFIIAFTFCIQNWNLVGQIVVISKQNRFGKNNRNSIEFWKKKIWKSIDLLKYYYFIARQVRNMVNNNFCLSHFGEGCQSAASSPPSLADQNFSRNSLKTCHCHIYMTSKWLNNYYCMNIYLSGKKLLLFVFVFIIYKEKIKKEKKNSFNWGSLYAPLHCWNNCVNNKLICGGYID